MKVEHLSVESRTLFSALDINLPDQYLLPGNYSNLIRLILPFSILAHESTSTAKSAEIKVREAYQAVKVADRRKIAEFYKLDLEMFEYTIDPDTLAITY